MVLEVHIDGYIFPLFPAKIAANWLSVCFGFVKLDGKRHEWWKIIARIIRHTVRRIRRGRPKSPSGVSFNTGRPPRSAPIRSWRSSVGKTNDINTVTQSVRIVWPLFFCPFSAEYTANQAAGFTMKSAAFFGFPLGQGSPWSSAATHHRCPLSRYSPRRNNFQLCSFLVANISELW